MKAKPYPLNNILVIAGEPSGDVRAGELIKELKKLLPDTSFWGIGGDNMESLGVELTSHIRSFSMVGVWEVAKNISKVHKEYRDLVKNVCERKPRLAILIDYPGFNLKVASFLHRNKIPVVYYIIPQVWAWGQSRLKTLKACVDKIIVLFKFEKDFLNRFGIAAEFSGHPLVDREIPLDRTPLHSSHDSFTIALLPGSRENEVRQMLPLMLLTASKIREYKKNISFTIAENSNVDQNLYTNTLSRFTGLKITSFKDDTFSCLASSDFAIVTSGTATLETAMMEKPMLITYRASFITYILFRVFMNIPFIGLVNIIAGGQIVPEFLQGNATAEKLSQGVLKIIDDKARMDEIRAKLRDVKNSLGEKGASLRAARIIHEFYLRMGVSPHP